MIRTAMVGLGKMGLSHLAILRAHPELDLVAVLAHRGVGAVSLDELDRHLVENRRGLADQGVEVRCTHRLTAASASGSVKRPA